MSNRRRRVVAAAALPLASRRCRCPCGDPNGLLPHRRRWGGVSRYQKIERGREKRSGCVRRLVL
ncbi:hypothetical protein LINPERHAP1_LOCUS31125 [Linum perenne]